MEAQAETFHPNNYSFMACAKVGRCKKAMELLKEMPTLGVSLYVITAVMTACGKGDRLKEA